MPARRYLLLPCVLVGIVAFTGLPRGQGPATAFHAVGDLTGGGVGSAVRDATRVSGTIYAVGASTVNATATLPNVPNLDTPALWTWPGSGTGTLEALPNTAVFVSTQTDPKTAYAITPDAAFIASQARPSNGIGTNWVRVTRSLLPSMTANLNLSNAPGTPAFAALAISDNGGVMYGQRQNGTGGFPTETRVPVRYEPGVGFNFPDLTPTGKAWGFPIPRGTSADGLAMVGAASDGHVVSTSTGGVSGTNAVAFRYEHTAGTLTGTTTTIPVLPNGGTWNMPVALSSDGNQTVVIGNSTDFPNGEVYLTDETNAISATLGSPNTALRPRVLGGMTADGSVVAVTFASGGGFGPGQIGGLGIPTGNRYAYVHNSNGWFHFSSILAAQGVDLVAMGWDPTNLAITGVRTVEEMDLVFGQGRRRTVGPSGYVDGAVEGFVAELPAGVLASFNPTPTPPSDESIVGAWAIGDPSNPAAVIAFLANGSFVRIASTGFERGLYSWAGNAAGGAFTMTTLYDTDGNLGLSGINGRSGLSLTVTGDTWNRTDGNCVTCTPVAATRVTVGPGSIVGGWVGGNPAEPDNTFAIVLLGSSAGYKYFAAFDQPAGEDDEVDLGTYTWDPVSHELIATPTGGVPDPQNFATLSPDELALFVIDDGGETFTLTRVVDPAAVAVVQGGEATATLGAAFSYQVSATNALGFGAAGLPAGLSINSGSGVISGTPLEVGFFPVTVYATNTFGSPKSATLNLTVVSTIVTTAGTGVSITPEVPPGTPGMTMTFDNVTTGGNTTVAVLDAETSPPPPGGFQIGSQPLYYEIETTATFSGPVTICFNYAGVDFGGQTPRLFHYVGGSWVDITTSVDAATTTLCGSTSSFSVFAIFSSPTPFVRGTGFYSPVSPLPGGFVNTSKAGSTVPLKFNVYVNGQEKTDTAGLNFSVTTIACTLAPGDPVDYVTQEDTNLRYAGHQFHLNWKTPKVPGCYIARVTNADGLLLSATFRLK